MFFYAVAASLKLVANLQIENFQRVALVSKFPISRLGTGNLGFRHCQGLPLLYAAPARVSPEKLNLIWAQDLGSVDILIIGIKNQALKNMQ